MKIVHSNPGVPEDEEKKKKELYDILEKVPAPLSRFNLTTSQKYWWYWFAKEFIKTDSFVKLDQIHLQTAAFWLDVRNKTLTVVNKMNQEDEKGLLPGMVQHFKGGSNNITAYVSLIEKADKALNRISEHFGLSIKDRKRIFEQPEQEDPNQLSLFEKFLNEKSI